MRILLYSSTLRDKPGGVQAVYARLGASLRRRGHAVTEAWSTPSPDGSSEAAVYPLARVVTKMGIPKPYSFKRVFQSFAGLIRGLRQHRPEVVNIHFVRGDAIYFLLLKWFFRYKVVLSAHGSDVLKPTRNNAKLLPLMLPVADAITAVTQRVADRILAYPGVDPRNVHVIPNGVDCDFWGDAASSPSANASPVILTVGRLTRVKGHDVLIRALARVREHVPDARLILVGDGNARAELEALAAELEVEQATEFTGSLSTEEVRALLHTAHVFALPSRSEGMPLALLEAMAAGVPPIATRVGGVPEVVEAGTGLLVPPDDPAALAEALTRVLTDAGLALELREGAAARARHFSATAAEAAYAQLFTDLANRP